MIFNAIFGILAGLSLILLIWQWLAALRFPIHQRVEIGPLPPAVTLLKPLKNCDPDTERCLRSWLTQDFTGEVQVLFGVESAADPACAVVQTLIQEFPSRDLQLVICGESKGANAKVSKLIQLVKAAKHDVWIVSDADVHVPPDFLTSALSQLQRQQAGLISCFYRLANPSTLAMQWEAVAVNADFWSQVLQSKSLKPLNFALGAVMITRRKLVQEIGGFEAVADCLADDYQLGNRIAQRGHKIELCPVVVDCWDPPMTWRTVWKHQVRWARTIRVCQPVPYFFSILSYAGLWASLWLAYGLVIVARSIQMDSLSDGFGLSLDMQGGATILAVGCLAIRMAIAFDLQRRFTRSTSHGPYFWMAPIKDLFQAAIWFCAFTGNRIEWRGEVYTLRRDGTLER